MHSFRRKLCSISKLMDNKRQQNPEQWIHEAHKQPPSGQCLLSHLKGLHFTAKLGLGWDIFDEAFGHVDS